jgi:hypothetical protein
MHHITRTLVFIVVVSTAVQMLEASDGQGNPQPSQGAPAAAAKPLARTDQRLESGTGFSVDFPKKDWQPLFGSGSSLIVLFHRSREVTVAVERTRVANVLAPSEITVETTAKLEIEDWMLRRPLATGFAPQIVPHEGERIIVIDFNQPGPRGLERVRMYTLPRGHDWFRVICTTTPATYEKYLDTCHKIALSLTPAAAR